MEMFFIYQIVLKKVKHHIYIDLYSSPVANIQREVPQEHKQQCDMRSDLEELQVMCSSGPHNLKRMLRYSNASRQGQQSW